MNEVLRIKALGWLEDCFPDCPDDLHDWEIVAAVNRHYEGGWIDFIRAGELVRNGFGGGHTVVWLLP